MTQEIAQRIIALEARIKELETALREIAEAVETDDPNVARIAYDVLGQVTDDSADCETQALTPTDVCLDWRCNKAPLILRGKLWACPKCGASYGEHAKASLPSVSGVYLPDTKQFAIEIDGIIAIAITSAVDEKWPTLKDALLVASRHWWLNLTKPTTE